LFDARVALGEGVGPENFLVLHAPKNRVAELADWLLAQGAERVSVSALEHVFCARNALYEALEAAIGR
jgi:ATP phosphoribosyltransferase